MVYVVAGSPPSVIILSVVCTPESAGSLVFAAGHCPLIVAQTAACVFARHGPSSIAPSSGPATLPVPPVPVVPAAEPPRPAAPPAVPPVPAVPPAPPRPAAPPAVPPAPPRPAAPCGLVPPVPP